jgi:hypothetical protein
MKTEQPSEFDLMLKRCDLFERKIAMAFIVLASDSSGVYYGEKIFIWMMMAYAEIPWWRKFYRDETVACMVLSRMIRLQREYEAAR